MPLTSIFPILTFVRSFLGIRPFFSGLVFIHVAGLYFLAYTTTPTLFDLYHEFHLQELNCGLGSFWPFFFGVSRQPIAVQLTTSTVPLLQF